jgi:hypothetical protein
MAINKRLRTTLNDPKPTSVPATSKPNGTHVADLAKSDAEDSKDSASSGDSAASKPVTIINVTNNTNQQKIMDKIRNVNIISKLPKDLTVKTTPVENSKQQTTGKVDAVKRKAQSVGPAAKRVGATTIRMVTDLTINSDSSDSDDEEAQELK